MKKLTCVLSAILVLTMLVVGMSVPVSAEVLSGNCGANGSNVTWVLDTSNGTLTILGEGKMKDHYYHETPWYWQRERIYNVIIGDSVTSVGCIPFHDCYNLTSITVDVANEVYHSEGNCLIETDSKTLIAGCKNSVIPTDGSVTSIGMSAFHGCSNLTSIEIPDSVTGIGMSAFSGCSNLTSIEIPDSVTSIGSSAFYGCSSLTSIEIPDSVTSIEFGAFCGCSKLTSIEIPDSVTSIGQHAFTGCDNLIETENGVSYVDKWVIFCDQTVSIVSLRSNTIGIANYAFSYHESLTDIEISNSVTTIGYGAFYNCTNLIRIKIPNSVTTIGYGAFYNCTNLIRIKIPNSVTSIGGSAFSGCSSLTSIEIPDSVTRFDYFAFYDCTDLTNITYYGTEVQWHEIEKVECWDYNTGDYTIIYHPTHEWDTGEITQQSTCSVDGIKTFTCKICCETKTEGVDKLSDHIYDDETDNTCNNCGFVRFLNEETEDNIQETDISSTDEPTTDTASCKSTVSVGAGLMLLLILSGTGMFMKKNED